MKNQYYNLALFLFSLFIMGCSNDNSIDTPKSTQLVPVGIRQVSVSGSAAVTRTSTTITKGQIGVFRTTAGGYPAQNNVPYSYNNTVGGWSATKSDNAILVDHRNAVLKAYYPYQSKAEGSKVTLESQVYSPEQDLCYGTSTGDINNTTPTAGKFTDMSHAYARLKLSITRAIAFVGTCNITNVNIKSSSNAFYVSRTLDINDSSYEGIVTSGGWSCNPNISSIISGENDATYDVLVPPQPIEGGLTITLTIDGTDYAIIISSESFSGSLSAGKQYTISLTITNASLTINDNVEEQVWSSTTNMGTVTDASGMN